MRNNVIWIVFLIIIFCLFLFPLLNNSFYISHDGENHVARIAAYSKSFLDGDIIPRWARDLNQTYGSPLFIFFYPLSGYLASGFHLLGFSLENSFKIVIGLGFVLAPVCFYLFIYELFKDRKTAFLGCILFGLVPYHVLNIYVRGDIGEVISFVFIPLVFLFIEKLSKKISVANIVLGGIFYGLLILSHNVMALIFSPIFLTYCLLRTKTKQHLIAYFMVFSLGLLLTSFFWLPGVIESKYINSKILIADMYKSHFLNINNLIYSKWGFGPDVNGQNGLSPQVGPLYVVLVILGIIGFIKVRKTRRELIYWIFIFIFASFMSLPLSDFLWRLLPFIKQFQFPWRFTALSSFAAIMIGCYVFSFLKWKKILIFFILLIIITSIPFLKVKDYINKGDNYYLNFKGTTYYHGEASTIWTAGDFSKSPKSEVEIIQGDAKINDLIRKNQSTTFSINSKTDSKILENTVYFPGWKATVDGKKTNIEFQDINHRGLITFNVPQGNHKVEIKFSESPVRAIADFISSISLIIVLLLLIFKNKINILLQKV